MAIHTVAGHAQRVVHLLALFKLFPRQVRQTLQIGEKGGNLVFGVRESSGVDRSLERHAVEDTSDQLRFCVLCEQGWIS
jgi:hypothetical protein